MKLTRVPEIPVPGDADDQQEGGSNHVRHKTTSGACRYIRASRARIPHLGQTADC